MRETVHLCICASLDAQMNMQTSVSVPSKKVCICACLTRHSDNDIKKQTFKISTLPINKHLPFVSLIDKQKKFKAMSMSSDALLSSDELSMSSDASLSSDESRSRRSTRRSTSFLSVVNRQTKEDQSHDNKQRLMGQ